MEGGVGGEQERGGLHRWKESRRQGVRVKTKRLAHGRQMLGAMECVPRCAGRGSVTCVRACVGSGVFCLPQNSGHSGPAALWTDLRPVCQGEKPGTEGQVVSGFGSQPAPAGSSCSCAL